MSPDRTERARVLVVIKGLGLGGAETLIAKSASQWDTATFDYRVAYMLPHKDQLVPALRQEEVEVDCLQWRGGERLGSIRKLRSLANTWEPDIVHSHLPLAGVFARTALSERHHVYTEHNIVDSYRWPSRIANRVTYARNSAVIAVSQPVADSIANYPGPDPVVIPNGVVVEEAGSGTRERILEELEVGRSCKLIVHVGNIRPHKGHENLIETVAEMTKSRTDFVVASIGGEKYPGDLESVRQKAAQHGVSEQIRFLGRRYDAMDFLSTADIVVNPSDFEGLPLVVLEALTLGRPVVATAVGGVPDVIRHGETGFLVEPRSPTQTSEALLALLEAPDLAAELASEGQALAKSHYSLNAMVNRYEDLYRKVVR